MPAVFLSNLVVGQRYRSKATGQLFVVVAARTGANGKGVRVRALSSAVGRGSARAIPCGETRDIANGHQWCQNVEHVVVPKPDYLD